jgi:S1-C subfamily serine protease
MFRGIQKSNIHIPLVALAMLTAETGHAQTAVQIGAMTPVAELATNDPIRHAAQPVGLLRAELNDGSARTCTTAIISDRYILTAAHCTVDAPRLTAIFAQGRETATFPVLTAPVEIDNVRDYAVLEVDGMPSQRFGVAKLLLRIPLKGESAFIISMNDTGGQTISRNCSVLETNDRGLVLHDCDTRAGSSGALLFSANDLAILGLQIGSADARSNRVISGRTRQHSLRRQSECLHA